MGGCDDGAGDGVDLVAATAVRLLEILLEEEVTSDLKALI